MLIFIAVNTIGCTPKSKELAGMDDKMEYSLETENGEIIDSVNNARILDEINRIDKDDVKPSEDYGFIILTPKERINNIQYIQMAKNVGSNEYTVEVRISDNKNFKHYQHFFTSKDEVISIFLELTNNKKLPNLQEWEDVSSQYR